MWPILKACCVGLLDFSGPAAQHFCANCMLEILYCEVSVWLHQADARLPVVWSKLQVQADARAHDLCERMLRPGVGLVDYPLALSGGGDHVTMIGHVRAGMGHRN